MVIILENSEHNVDFYPMVDFVEASPLRYALTFKPTVYVSHIRQFWSTARIETTEEGTQILATVDDESASPLRDVSQGEAYPNDSGFLADQDRATIAKSSTLPHDSAPQVTSPVAVEGTAEGSGDDALVKGRNLDEGEAAAERASDDTKEMATILTSIDAVTVLASRAAEVPTSIGSIPTVGPPAAEDPTGSDVVPTASPVFATATVVTPYRRRKGQEVMVKSETPKKQKFQEQIDAQVARELEEQLEREDKRMSEQIARDAKVARIHVEEELQSMIDGLDRSNKIQKRDYYMAVIRSNLGWKVKDFRGMTFKEVEAKFNSIWKQIEDFIPMSLKEETKRLKRKGLSLEQESAEKFKPSDEVPEEVKLPDEVPEEKVKEMMQLVPIKEVYVKALQVKHPIIDWKHLDREDLNQLWALVKEYLSNRLPTSDKDMEL
uniref:Xylulose kinase-1 n=1 Tax=Tanacetum cinerariifolium TaxID=118510 RepID=A0A6L2NXJ2_TANCI|nr:hypothetical protein [Tanacetum cinerariifolium]